MYTKQEMAQMSQGERLQRERQIMFLGGSLFLLYAARQRSWLGMASAALVMGMLYRGVTGRPLLGDGANGGTAVSNHNIQVKQTLTVNTTPEEAYAFWRNLENLPHFMEHLESVQMMGDGRSHWVVNAPAGVTLEWDAEIVEDQPNKLIRWQTLPSATVQHAGRVEFAPAPAGRGTEVTAAFRYDPPGGVVGEAFAHLSNAITSQQIREELRRFKAVLETGERPTIEGQPSGRAS